MTKQVSTKVTEQQKRRYLLVVAHRQLTQKVCDHGNLRVGCFDHRCRDAR